LIYDRTSESRYEGGKEGRIKALDRKENKRTSNEIKKRKSSPPARGHKKLSWI
jgi:hypothetical protein